MLLEYLQERYRVNEPIFVSDIALPVTNTNLRQMFKVLCDSGQIMRYDTGIYYLKGKSKLKGGTVMAADEVARYKYISRNNQINGYYSGYTFANQLGLTTQVPFTIEIVSNYSSAKYREISLKNQKIILRKPRTQVTNENCNILQFLDLLKDLEIYADDISDAAKRLSTYAKELRLCRTEIDEYIGFFPERIYKNIYETRLYNVFA